MNDTTQAYIQSNTSLIVYAWIYLHTKREELNDFQCIILPIVYSIGLNTIQYVKDRHQSNETNSVGGYVVSLYRFSQVL